MDSTHIPILHIRPIFEIVNSKEYIDFDSTNKKTYVLLSKIDFSNQEILEETELGIKSIKTARKNTKNNSVPGIVGRPTLLSEAQEDLLRQEICKKIKTKEFPDTLDAIQMRFQASIRRVIRPWLVLLIHLLTLWMIDIEDIWNLDESSLQIRDGKSRRINTKRLMKVVYRQTVQQQPNTTLTVCCSGRGDMLKAQVIVHAKSIPPEFKRLNEDLFIVVFNDCGWQIIVTFEDYMVNYVLPEIAHRRENNGVSTRSLLLLDSHASRMNRNIINKALELKIHILTFSSHITHLLQPLDCGIFSTLKQRLRNVFIIPIQWTASLYRKTIVEVFQDANKRAIQSEIIKKGFKTASICPIDINAKFKNLPESWRIYQIKTNSIQQSWKSNQINIKIEQFEQQLQIISQNEKKITCSFIQQSSESQLILDHHIISNSASIITFHGPKVDQIFGQLQLKQLKLEADQKIQKDSEIEAAKQIDAIKTNAKKKQFCCDGSQTNEENNELEQGNEKIVNEKRVQTR